MPTATHSSKDTTITRILDAEAIAERGGVAASALPGVVNEAVTAAYDDRVAALSALNPATVTIAQLLAALGGPIAVIPDPLNTTLPVITGTKQVGFILTATPGVWSNAPTVTGVWYRGNTATSRTGLTYVLDTADIGFEITYVETALSARSGLPFNSSSAPTTAIIAASVAPPVNTLAPVVSGTNTFGSVLTTNNGTWTNSPTSYVYEWQRNGVAISGATSSTYTVQAADLGQAIQCRVTATNVGGAAGVVASNSKTIVAPLAISGTPGAVAIALSYSFNPTVSGGSGLRTFALSGNTLPTGFTFSTTTGSITKTGTATIGTTSGLIITVSDASGSPSASLGPFNLVRNNGAWDVGLARKPSYVPVVSRPASIAAGKTAGIIPANALSFATGNNGTAFADWGAWIDACNLADVAGAIDVDLVVPTLGKRYIKRGIYGAGATEPKITYSGRTSGHAKGGSLFVYTEDVVLQDVNFVNFSNIICVSYPTLRLAASGALTAGSPYFTGNDPAYFAANSGTDGLAGGSADGFHVRQLGTIAITGAVSISGINVVRQIPATDGAGTDYSLRLLDADWYATCETVPLFSGAACTTHAQVRDAINANSATTGFAAELKADGTVRLLPVSRNTRAPDEINVVKTGTGSVAANNRTPKVSIIRCTLTDCDNGYIAILDTLALGPIDLLDVDCPGTWNLLAAPVLRWTDLRVAGCRWRDVMPTRTLAAGRASSSVTTSQLPPGSSLTARGTFVWLGNDKAAKMRYHGADGGNLVLIENNDVDQVESVNNTNTVNCAVFFDIRNAWQVTANGKIVRIAYNKARHLIGTKGAEDCNWGYLKARAYTILGNDVDGFGDAWVANTSTQDGCEAGGQLNKNPQDYNKRGIAGIAAAGGGADPEDCVIRGNKFVGGPTGCTYCKFDEVQSIIWFDQNLIDGWDNIKGTVPNTAGPSTGAVRFTGAQYGARVNSNRFRNCDPRGGNRWHVNFWNLTTVGTVDGSRWSFHSNEFWGDKVTWTADTDLVTYNGSTSNSFMTNFVTGFNKLLTSTGADTGFKATLRVDGGASFPGNLAAAYVPYGSIDFLQSYGFTG